MTECPPALPKLESDAPDGSASYRELLNVEVISVLVYDDCADGKSALIRAYYAYRDAVADREKRRAAPPAAEPFRWWWQR